MHFLRHAAVLTTFLLPVLGSIWDNSQLRPPTEIDSKLQFSLLDKNVSTAKGWKTYLPTAPEISYKGRWDSKYISWWAGPGLKFGFTGEKVAISFGKHTIPGTHVAYRVGGLDWQFTNVTANATHQFVSSRPLAKNLKTPQVFEMRVTNWGYGVQLAGVHVDAATSLSKIKPFKRTIEVIGDSLSAGMYGSYEALSGWAFLTAYGLGNTEFSITAYPGICVTDQDCWGNKRGQVFQWKHAQDGSWRQQEIYGMKPEPWNFTQHAPADIVIINIGTNDNNTANNVTTRDYVTSYTKLVTDVHETYPKAQIVLMGLWNGFSNTGQNETYTPSPAFVEEIPAIVESFNPKKKGKKGEPYVHYFDVNGILQHNDIGPGTWHPTDIGQLKVAAHMQQYIKTKFGWAMENTGEMVHSGTYIYNDQSGY